VAAVGGVGVWTTNGPGDVTSIAVVTDAQVPGTLYAGTAQGVAKSTDGGKSWNAAVLPGGTPLAASGGVVYASVATPVGPPIVGGFTNVVYESPDGGAHWQALYQISSATSAMWIDPVASSTLYRADTAAILPPYHQTTAAGFFRSNDAGQSWTRIDAGLGSNPVTAFAADPQSPGTVYLANVAIFEPPGVYRSTDSGSTWTLMNSSIPAYCLAVDPTTAGTVYAAGVGVFVSNDGGVAFRSLGAPTGFVAALVVDPASSRRLYAATSQAQSGVSGSSDGGANWWPMNQGLPGSTPSVGGLVLDAKGDALYTSLNGNVWDFEIDPATLVLDSAHPFAVTLSATDPHTGASASGIANKVNDLWGYFSIPAITGNPSNPEVFVKMLDGTAINGEYWFFYGGLTNLAYTLTVTDVATGATKTYTKPAGSECGGSDTGAFKQ